MGGALFSKPWMDLPESKNSLDFLKSYKPQNKEVKHVRILLHGPTGAGKSSFINSVRSVTQGRLVVLAPTDATSGKSFTKKYRTYKIPKDEETFYSFVFNDTMGFEENQNAGVNVEDVILALKGHVKEDHEFTPGKQLKEKDQSFNSSPTLDDKVHVLVSVVPANSVSILSPEIVNKMRDVRVAASEIGIPQIALLTKIDEACPKVKDNIKNAYRSKHLKEKVEQFHKLLGVSVNCIFLLENYSVKSKTNNDMDAQILCALRQMVEAAEDHLNDLDQRNTAASKTEKETLRLPD